MTYASSHRRFAPAPRRAWTGGKPPQNHRSGDRAAESSDIRKGVSSRKPTRPARVSAAVRRRGGDADPSRTNSPRREGVRRERALPALSWPLDQHHGERPQHGVELRFLRPGNKTHTLYFGTKGS